MYDIKAYYQPRTLDEAFILLEDCPDGKIIAGGSDVLIRIREGRMAGCTLIGIRDIQELNHVFIDEQRTIHIGALMTFSHLTQNEIIKEYLPVLGAAVDQVGGPQVRNIGTIGGNICNGAVSADSAPTLFSLNAQVELLSTGGVRRLPIEAFYLGPGKVDLKPGEILGHILIAQKDCDGYYGHYIKYAMRNAMDIATLGCSVVVKLDRTKKVLEDVRITFGVAAPVPLKCSETAKRLYGLPLNEELYELLENSVRREINPRDSWRASKAFRLQIGGEIAVRALKKAVKLAGGDGDE